METRAGRRRKRKRATGIQIAKAISGEMIAEPLGIVPQRAVLIVTLV
jgi:hypothetical protein